MNENIQLSTYLIILIEKAGEYMLKVYTSLYITSIRCHIKYKIRSVGNIDKNMFLNYIFFMCTQMSY